MILNAAAVFLRLFPAETAHRATIALTEAFASLLPTAPAADPRLSTRVFGLDFPNPIGLAAGFDKDARVPDSMLRVGFGFVECGSITPRPQSGNPMPRLFRLPEDGAVINRMGFNNAGVDAAAARLSRRARRGIVGINLGANKDSTDRVADYRAGLARLGPLADYVTINVSSPNTPGLRGLQNRDELEKLLAAVMEERERLARRVPVLVKIAPDLDDAALDDIAAVVLAAKIDGLVVSNTTIARPASLRGCHAQETGGLSGTPLLEPSTHILREMYRRVGQAMPLVGVGGIGSGADAYAKIRAGASLVQLYTALAYAGPGLVTQIAKDLTGLLARDGYSRVADAVGRESR